MKITRDPGIGGDHPTTYGELTHDAPRKAHYRVKLHLDGADEVGVTIERGTTHQLVTVRPKGKRTTYTLSLAVVASMISYRVAKNMAEDRILDSAAEKRAKKVQRRRR